MPTITFYATCTVNNLVIWKCFIYGYRKCVIITKYLEKTSTLIT